MEKRGDRQLVNFNSELLRAMQFCNFLILRFLMRLCETDIQC